MTGEEASRLSVIAVDLGGTNLRIAGVDEKGTVITSRREGTGASGGPQAVLSRLVAGVREVESALTGSGWGVIGVSCGIPGVIARERGVVSSSPNLPGWNELPFLELVRDEIDMPLMIENDANAAAFGEFWAGAARQRKNAVLMTLGTGVGGGIIVDGKLVRGFEGMAGEIGHLTVEREGEKCPCGNSGCLERYASASGIARRYAERMGSGGTSGREKDPTAEDVFRKACEGDVEAREVFREAGMYLGIALASIVNILNPEAAIIGGGAMEAWDYFMPYARAEMLKRAFRDPAEKVELLRAELGDSAGVIGAAGLFWEEWRRSRNR